jgi:hypothetical protein
MGCIHFAQDMDGLMEGLLNIFMNPGVPYKMQNILTSQVLTSQKDTAP